MQYQCYGGPFTSYYVCHQNYNLPRNKSIFDLSQNPRKFAKGSKEVPSTKTKEGHGCSVMSKDNDKNLPSPMQNQNLKGEQTIKNGNDIQEGFTSDWNFCLVAGSVAVNKRSQNKRDCVSSTSIKRSLPGLGQNKERKDIFLQMRSTSMVKERKVTRMLIALVVIFAFCWLPFFIVYVSEPFCRQGYSEIVSGNVNVSKSCIFLQDGAVFDIVTWLGYSNSMFNPIIYTLFMKDFRVILKKCCCTFK